MLTRGSVLRRVVSCTATVSMIAGDAPSSRPLASASAAMRSASPWSR
jgi:hypothetical protein